MPQSLIDERREEDGSPMLKAAKGSDENADCSSCGIRCDSLAGRLRSKHFGPCRRSGAGGVGRACHGDDEKGGAVRSDGARCRHAQKHGNHPCLNAYLIVGLIPHYTLEDGQLRKDMFDIAVLMQNERVVACQEALYWVPQNDSDPNIEGAIAYPRWRNAPFDGYELLLAEGVPLAEIAIRNGADEADWLVRQDGVGVLVGGSGFDQGDTSVSEEAPLEIMVVLDQLTFSSPSSSVEFVSEGKSAE